MDIKPVRRPARPQTPGQTDPVLRPPIQQRPLPKRPLGPVQQPPLPPIAEAPATTLPTGNGDDRLKKVRKNKKLFLVIAIILALSLVLVGGLWAWYQVQLQPADSQNTAKVEINILEETTPTEIAELLEEEKLIKNKTAFLWYARINNVQNDMKYGLYQLSPSQTAAEIVSRLVKGDVSSLKITFYPGATLTDKVSKVEDRKDVTSVLLRAGYGEDEIAKGLRKAYDHPLFEDKPTTADLEGYVFGETYEFNSGVSVEDILNRTFDEFYKWIVQSNLVAAYKEQGLNLYQGITLASIIQRESGGDDKAQIAQVFYTRLAMKMPLGSDVTYQYIADKEGRARDTNYDSPYNTRRYVGLPPGPIAAPGLAALRAVAMPAAGDYVYFLSGDDDVTYFARTLDEHEANIANHCKLKCQII